MQISETLIDKLKTADRVVALTGAGVSAESGVPTFRGEEGIWRNYRAEELATPEAFTSDPKLVWEFYCWRRDLIADISPNPSHDTLAEMEKRYPNFLLITQNVDGLHEKAGSRKLLELHGNIWKVRCVTEGRVTETREKFTDIPPTCDCGALLRPHVVWFGEGLDPAVLNDAFEASGGSELFIVAGTSGVVQPAASLPVVAKRAGAYVVEINTQPNPISTVADETLLGKSGEIFPSLLGVLDE
jgi:NAD-dependent deacetylase